MPAVLMLVIDGDVIDETDDFAGCNLDKTFANQMLRAEVGEFLLKYQKEIKSALPEAK